VDEYFSYGANSIWTSLSLPLSTGEQGKKRIALWEGTRLSHMKNALSRTNQWGEKKKSQLPRLPRLAEVVQDSAIVETGKELLTVDLGSKRS